jgi:hypothetical protein
VYPKGWEFVDGYGFLPTLRRIVAKPGVNGVNRAGNLSRAIAGAIQKGGTYIDPKDERLGDFKDYVRFYECDTGARWYVDLGQEATILPGGEILWNSEDASEELRKFRAHIRDTGMIPPMAPEVYRWLSNRVQNAYESQLSRAGRNPHLAQKAEQTAAKLDAMRSEWERLSGARVQKAKKAGKGKKLAPKVSEVTDG